ncbi:hypothetical protein [Alkalicoccus saliphilus]|uniref:hypothetical protein n=1 Tax=Alkalicoccus saliphilus TaxID=200989 RepID=UPI00135774CC|nr:hypothetical protein [Alkalicoccus saliphilus]
MIATIFHWLEPQGMTPGGSGRGDYPFYPPDGRIKLVEAVPSGKLAPKEKAIPHILIHKEVFLTVSRRGLQ